MPWCDGDPPNTAAPRRLDADGSGYSPSSNMHKKEKRMVKWLGAVGGEVCSKSAETSIGLQSQMKKTPTAGPGDSSLQKRSWRKDDVCCSQTFECRDFTFLPRNS